MDILPLPPRPHPEQYRQQAKALVAAAASNDPAAIRVWASEWLTTLVRLLAVELTPFVRDSMDRAVERIVGHLRERRLAGASFTLGDAQLFIAEAHGFENWGAFVEHLERLSATQTPGDLFENAADAVVSGDVVTLSALLRRHPDLIRARSARVHRATLLHYVAANGVEDFRQKTPPNAVAVAQLLLEAGAAVDALANTYGGGSLQTTLNLLVSSVHPAEARLHPPLVETLLDYGAAVNGLDDDASPLMTAISFGYPSAATALAQRGARVDNVIAAAALGRLDLVRRFVRDRATLAPGVRLMASPWSTPMDDPGAHIDQAFLAACRFGHADVIAFLLEIGVDIGVSDDMTGLHSAAGHRYIEAVRLLLARGAPLEVRNKWGGTVLDSTVWFAMNPPIDHPHRAVDPGYIPILEALIAAGANVAEVTPFPTGNEHIDALLRRHGRP
jgi:ankyrin repeat protein